MVPAAAAMPRHTGKGTSFGIWNPHLRNDTPWLCVVSLMLIASQDHCSGHLRPRGKALFFPRFMGEEMRHKGAGQIAQPLWCRVALHPVHVCCVDSSSITPSDLHQSVKAACIYGKADDEDWNCSHWPSVCSWHPPSGSSCHRLSAFFHPMCLSQGRRQQKCRAMCTQLPSACLWPAPLTSSELACDLLEHGAIYWSHVSVSFKGMT